MRAAPPAVGASGCTDEEPEPAEPPGESARAAARSTHDPPGDARPEVERAVRH
ncbi:hypothetical protein [Streptomyces sp. Tu 3180]|uniref:hypothetical protein n=1 Tax=Streptomyces sp. Tu 3180 TaxID=2682611 RepID=UPI00135CEA6E|nr:hypothetical protein [Streptomyces sp. Tu 3180]KAF3466475.1 hypothetical protein GL259_20550 [Streptomyces sp. Tu 3180]